MIITKTQIDKICKRMDIKLIKFSFLARGNHNDNYLIEAKGRRYILRIENNPQFKNLEKEYKTLKSLKSGLGPHVYLFDNSHKIISNDYLIEEFITGKHPKEKVLDNFVIAMAKWLRKLHKIKTSKLPEFTKKGYYSLSCAIKPYYNNFKKYKHNLQKEQSNKLELLFQRALELCKKNDKIFQKHKSYSLLHRDLSKDNIFINNHKIKLVDWEFAGYGVPEWDLVYFLQSYKFKKYHTKLFLETYGYSNTKTARKKLELISLLNICGGVGYSTWRLNLIKNGKIDKQGKNKIVIRLKKDVKIFKGVIKSLEK